MNLRMVARRSPSLPLPLLSLLAAATLLQPHAVSAGPVGAAAVAPTSESAANASSVGCRVGGAEYRAGDAVPGRSACEACTCGAGGELACGRRACAVRAGCKALHRPDECCPTYQCDCEQDGRVYGNGEKLVDAADPCKVCYCQGGEVVCRRIACFLRADCEPRPARPGRCCPEYDHCPLRGVTVDADKSPGITTSVTSSTVMKMFENISQVNKDNAKKEITIKEVTPVSEIPAITGVRIKEVAPSRSTAAQQASSAGASNDAHREQATRPSEQLTKPLPSAAATGKPPSPSPEEEEPFELVNPAFPPLPDDLSVLGNHEEDAGDPHTELATSPPPLTLPPSPSSPPSTSSPPLPLSRSPAVSPPSAVSPEPAQSPPSPASPPSQVSSEASSSPPSPTSAPSPSPAPSESPSSPPSPELLPSPVSSESLLTPLSSVSPPLPPSPPSTPSPALPPSPSSVTTSDTVLNAITEAAATDSVTGGLEEREKLSISVSTEQSLEGKLLYKALSTSETQFSDLPSALPEVTPVESDIFGDGKKSQVTAGDRSPPPTSMGDTSGTGGAAWTAGDDATPRSFPTDATSASSSQIFTESLTTDAPTSAVSADTAPTDGETERSHAMSTGAPDGPNSTESATENSSNTGPSEVIQFVAEVAPTPTTSGDSAPETPRDGEAPRAALIAPPAPAKNNVLTDLINLVGDVASFGEGPEPPAAAAAAEIEQEEGELPVTDAPPPHDDTEPTTRRAIIDRVSHEAPSVAAAPPSRDIEIIGAAHAPPARRRPTKVLMKKSSERAEPEDSPAPSPSASATPAPAPAAPATPAGSGQ